MLKLITSGTSPYLDRFKLNDFKFIVGPHLINGNHWLALIIDLSHKRFMLLDPMQPFFSFDSQYECWINYYNKRKDADLSISWHHDSIYQIPIQTDYFNCGIFTITFIEQFVLNGSIYFPTDSNHLFSLRQKVEKKIIEYFK